MENRIIKKGQTIILTSGSYSDYGIGFLAIALKDIDMGLFMERYLVKHPKQRQHFWFDEGRCIKWLLSEGYLKPLPITELCINEDYDEGYDLKEVAYDAED